MREAQRRVILGSILLLLAGLLACGAPQASGPPELFVAAAANLEKVFPEIGARFEEASGVKVVFSFGATANLAQQIENGAPFDLYAAADVEHVDRLVEKGILLADSRRIYAQGRLVVWTREDSAAAIGSLEDLADPRVRFVSIPKPDFAPYGRAAVEALRAAGVWERIEPKIVYAQNVRMARQYVDSGNAEAALTAMSIVIDSPERSFEVERSLYGPIRQAAGLVAASSHKPAARRFLDFILAPEARRIFERYGYSGPGS